MRIPLSRIPVRLKINWVLITLTMVSALGILFVSFYPSLYLIFPVNIYLTLHTLTELLSIVIGMTVSIVAWYNYQQKRELPELLICLVFLAVSLMDFAHCMSYNGMPDFFTPNSVNKASTYWVTARIIQAVGILAVVSAKRLKIESKLNVAVFFFITVIVSTALVAYIAVGAPQWPPMYKAGVGQTTAKVVLEYVIIVVEMAALVYMVLKKHKDIEEIYLEAALIFGIFSEVAFTMYSSAYDTYNLVGHIYKIASFICILRGLFVTSVIRLHESNRVLREQQQKLSEINTQLARINKLKTDFLANTNHELRTPLTAIIAFTELLMDRETGPLNEIQQDYLQEINDSSQKLLREINNLLDLSRIEAGKVKVHLERAMIEEVISSVLRQLIPVFNQKNQKIVTGISSDIPAIVMDVEKIKKVLVNLLSNAHKFTPQGGSIAIESEISQDRQDLIVRVLDNGIGLSGEQVTRIFDRFYQVENSLTNKQHGTGLGLTLVKHFVELHNGRVWVSSDPGKGSIFSFTIPMNLPTEEAV